MTTQNLVQGGEAGRWDQAIYAFIAEKERRSGSMRTVQAYSGLLYRFFGTLGKPPDQVTATEMATPTVPASLARSPPPAPLEPASPASVPSTGSSFA